MHSYLHTLIFKPWEKTSVNRPVSVWRVAQARYQLSEAGTTRKPLPLSGLIQQTTNWWYFSYLSQKTGFDILSKLSPLDKILPRVLSSEVLSNKKSRNLESTKSRIQSPRFSSKREREHELNDTHFCLVRHANNFLCTLPSLHNF